MNDVEKLIVYLDKKHSDYMNVKSLHDMNISVNVYQKTSQEGLDKAGFFDFRDKENYPTIYIHEGIVRYAPTIVFQYVLAHEMAHVIQKIYYDDLLIKEYPTYQWHGPSFKKILSIFGYDNLEIFENIKIPHDLFEFINNAGPSLSQRYTLERWEKEEGSKPPIKYVLNS